MKISKKDFERAVSESSIPSQQAEALWSALENCDASRPKLELAYVAYYFGALIVISAMGWFMTEAWESFGGGGILLLAALYAFCFARAGWTFWSKEQLKIPGGLLFTMAVCMTPLVIYGIERVTGFWPQGDPGTYRDYHIWVKGSWLFMEAGTIIAGFITLKFFRFPFLTAPIAFSLWYMSMDLTPLLLGQPEFTWAEREWVSLWFGLLMLLFSYRIDRRTKEDYAFWGYLFGMLAFWGGMSLMNNDSELNKFYYCLINLALILLSVLLQRRVFIVFGSLGVFGYLGHLSYRVFKDSLLFPFALTLLGLLIIYLGVLYQRKRKAWEDYLLKNLPVGLKRLQPSNRLPPQ
ncbi:MAG: DUF2157 domain-containing protein [Verrucomicrobia bacterium]|nr:DUF2157 domain-containing protein [Verrucomicrobiota bacterium]